MASLGIGRSGAGFVPALQRAWVEFVESVLKGHQERNDTIDVVAADVRALARWATRALVLGAVSLLGIFVVKLIEVIRG